VLDLPAAGKAPENGRRDDDRGTTEAGPARPGSLPAA